ncbi:hypothetical protein [Stappia indica]|uniref:hypothetical protein n=1 Tax=Stappia indica TaxID=538381 RepID=UPI0011122A93|nr:hypothetical protein [Stappia indica]
MIAVMSAKRHSAKIFAPPDGGPAERSAKNAMILLNFERLGWGGKETDRFWAAMRPDFGLSQDFGHIRKAAVRRTLIKCP